MPSEPPEPLNVADYDALAREALAPATYEWFSGGAGDERTLRANRDAFARWVLRPRVLVDVSGVTARTTVLGTEVSMPVLVAPFAFHRMAHPAGEPATARAAAAAGTVMCVPTFANTSFADVAAAVPGAPRWYQVYAFADEGLTRDLCAAAIDGGAAALVLTVDAPVRGRREGELRTGWRFPPGLDIPAAAGVAKELGPLDELVSKTLSWRDLEQLAAWSRVPVLVKGVLTAEDARLACDHGAAAVVVSNHGGRQLDGVPASLDALPEVVDAVDGRVEVLADGGIRRGVDVAVALALGARAVLVGRPAVWALAARGEEGVRHVLALLRAEVELALALLGCASPADVRRDHVARAPA